VLEGRLAPPRSGRKMATTEPAPRETRARAQRVAAAPQPADYAGTYFSQDLAVSYHIVARPEGLVLHRPRTDPVELVPLSGDDFRVRRGPVSVRFVREQGAVTGLIVDAGRARGLHFDRQRTQTASAGGEAGEAPASG
jgi:hypothetical protein